MSLGPLMEDGKQPERIVCPFDRETATIGILIYPMKSQAVADNWTCEATLGDDILKVCSLVVLTLRETSLTTSQKLRDSFKDVHWMSGIATIMPAETVISK